MKPKLNRKVKAPFNLHSPFFLVCNLPVVYVEFVCLSVCLYYIECTLLYCCCYCFRCCWAEDFSCSCWSSSSCKLQLPNTDSHLQTNYNVMHHWQATICLQILYKRGWMFCWKGGLIVCFSVVCSWSMSFVYFFTIFTSLNFS